MYAIVKKERKPGLTILDVDSPKLKENDILVKVEVASICGTDVHIWKWDKWAQKRISKIPLVIGHEFAGKVVDVGSAVKSVRIGDRVSAETHIVDKTCYQCKTGKMHVCQNMKILGVDVDGAFAEYVAIPEMNAWKNDPNLELEIATIQEPLGNAVHAILPSNSPEDIAGSYVAVLGCGPIGLMSIAVLRTLGAEKIFATEIVEKRLRLAEKIGADLVINPTTEDVVKIIHEETGGRGVDVVLEMSGAPSAIKQAFKIVTPGGRISLLGLPGEPIPLDISGDIVLRSVTIYGITGRRMFRTWFQVKGLLSRPDFRNRIKMIISHKFPMRDIEKAMDLLAHGEAVKIVLEPKW